VVYTRHGYFHVSLTETVPDVFHEFSGRMQEATQEMMKEVQQVLVSIAIDKKLPLFVQTCYRV
jgi:hypothetical protein